MILNVLLCSDLSFSRVYKKVELSQLPPPLSPTSSGHILCWRLTYPPLHQPRGSIELQWSTELSPRNWQEKAGLGKGAEWKAEPVGGQTHYFKKRLFSFFRNLSPHEPRHLLKQPKDSVLWQWKGFKTKQSQRCNWRDRHTLYWPGAMASGSPKNKKMK